MLVYLKMRVGNTAKGRAGPQSRIHPSLTDSKQPKGRLARRGTDIELGESRLMSSSAGMKNSQGIPRRASPPGENIMASQTMMSTVSSTQKLMASPSQGADRSALFAAKIRSQAQKILLLEEELARAEEILAKVASEEQGNTILTATLLQEENILLRQKIKVLEEALGVVKKTAEEESVRAHRLEIEMSRQREGHIDTHNLSNSGTADLSELIQYRMKADQRIIQLTKNLEACKAEVSIDNKAGQDKNRDSSGR